MYYTIPCVYVRERRYIVTALLLGTMHMRATDTRRINRVTSILLVLLTYVLRGTCALYLGPDTQLRCGVAYAHCIDVARNY